MVAPPSTSMAPSSTRHTGSTIASSITRGMTANVAAPLTLKGCASRSVRRASRLQDGPLDRGCGIERLASRELMIEYELLERRGPTLVVRPVRLVRDADNEARPEFVPGDLQ